jgi:predicted transcriptional regulator
MYELIKNSGYGKNAITPAREARLKQGGDTDWELYELINKRPGYSAYELARELGWSTGRVYGSIKRLKAKNLVRVKKSIRNGRAVLEITPVEWHEFFTSEELEEFREMEV